MDPEVLSGLLQAIQSAVSSSHQRDDDVALPIFDPERHDDGAATWCESIEKLSKEFNWSSLKTAAKAGKALKGSALSWFESWEPTDGRSWENFSIDIKDAYPEKRNLAEKLRKAVLYTSDSAESYSEYAREKIRLFRSTKIVLTDLQLIELVCGGINDVDVRMASLNSSVTTTATLISLLSSYSKAKKRSLDISTNKDDGLGLNGVKRLKPNKEMKCFSCGKIGHIQSQCRQRSLIPQAPNLKSQNSHTKICTFCKKLGHLEAQCYHKQRTESSSSITLAPTPQRETNFLGRPN